MRVNPNFDEQVFRGIWMRVNSDFDKQAFMGLHDCDREKRTQWERGAVVRKGLGGDSGAATRKGFGESLSRQPRAPMHFLGCDFGIIYHALDPWVEIIHVFLPLCDHFCWHN
jgi:hypothetical protein